jgi:phage terminase large subunit
MELFNKQLEAVYWLRQPEINEVLYGGAAGGGKSALGCLWLIEMCQTYEGSRWLMGRSKLKTLKETTLNTFFQLSSKLGISDQYEYKAQAGTIDWHNGSQIILKDLFLYPADPEFDGLGSLEITGAFIDEVSQIAYKAWQIVKSRIRYKLNEFGLTPKLFASCNPAKNWTYKQFYQPNKEGNLKPYRAFVRALPTDNPHLPPSYLQSLLELDENSKQRLYFGNWDYDDDPSRLCDYESILGIFKNNHVQGEKKYITADIARFGSDKAIIFVWEGWKVIDKKIFPKSNLVEIQNAINDFRMRYQIPTNQCIADEDGVGGGVVDNCQIKGFVNNSQPLFFHGMKENYYNLQTQCAYGLAKQINSGSIYIECKLSELDQDEIIEELGQLKTWKQDQDGKLYIMPKDEVKAVIGRSPDWRDVLLMRYYFEHVPKFFVV